MPAVSVRTNCRPLWTSVGVDGVARGAGFVAGDHPFLPEERVDQRALAHVGPADDGQADRRVLLRQSLPRLVSGGAGSRATTASSDASIPRPCSAETANTSLEAQPVEVRRCPVSCQPRLSSLLTTSSSGLPLLRSVAATSSSAAVGPARPSTTKRITSASSTASCACSRTCREQRVLLAGHEAAGVDDGELPALPLGVRVVAVAGDAGRRPHERQAPADQAVEERGLAHVGAADDGDQRLHFTCS